MPAVPPCSAALPLQPVDRARGAPLPSGVPVLRHRFVGTGGPGGGRFRSPEELAGAVAAAWGAPRHARAEPYVVCTGGEPLLQLDAPAVDAFHRAGFSVGVETNGTGSPRPGWTGSASPQSGGGIEARPRP